MPNCANVAATLHAHLCEHDWHGYTQGGGRWGDGEGVCVVNVDGRDYGLQQGDRDCSSSVIECWQLALQGTAYDGALGTLGNGGPTYTGNMRSAFVGTGLFEWQPMSFTAQRGDVYLNERDHTAMCQSAVPDMLSQFSINELGGIVGGQVGDQTGGESSVRSYYDCPWDGILHYNGGADEAAPATDTPRQEPVDPSGIPDLRYRVRAGGVWLPEMINHTDTGGSGDDYAGNGGALEYIAIDMPGWYQVRTQANGWLDHVRGYNIDDLDYGCAGDGSPITGVRCYYETQNPGATGWLAVEYAVANVGCGFLACMRDLVDTGGSGDDFAGDGGAISALRARLVRA